MEYEKIVEGRFISRPNRFIAHVEVDGRTVVSHVKNTGRCRELLLPGARVFLEYHPEAAEGKRKTAYDLIGVYKGDTLINMDSQAPNRVAWEWMQTEEAAGVLAGEAVCGHAADEMAGEPARARISNLRREVFHGDSRFDLAFTLETEGREPQEAFMEVKGVTLEEDGVAMFPDAPTERGIRHLEGLAQAVKDGYGAAALFVIQMKGVHAFSPHRERHPEFADALKKAKENGVHIWAYDCAVTDRSMKLDAPVPVIL